MKKQKINAIELFGFICKFLLATMLVSLPVVQASDLNAAISSEDKAKFDEILTPISKVYNFIKYAASLVAAIALLFAGISYMFSGDDIKKRETSKHMATYTIIGLAVIWAAPFVVNLLIS